MLFVFDLDFTLWDAAGTWCDHTQPPYVLDEGRVFDQTGGEIRLYDDVIDILNLIKTSGNNVALASRTSAPDWAEELLEIFGILDYVLNKQIYPGSKLTHFKQIHDRTKIHYSNMCFFDDEMRNINDVSSLGVHCTFIEDGIKMEHIEPFIN